jgi:putative membrane protein
MTLIIGEKLMAMSGIFVFTLPIAISAVLIIRRTNRYSRDELAEHLRDYPYSPLTLKRG